MDFLKKARESLAWRILWTAIQDYSTFRGARQAAALAFYAVFSLAPLLIVAVAIVGFVFGEQAARGEVFYELRVLVGEELARFVQQMVEQASYGGSGAVATAIGLGTLLYGSSMIFTALRDALNMIWHVEAPDEVTWLHVVRDYALSLALVPMFGMLFLVMVISTTVISAASDWLATYAEIPHITQRVTDLGVSWLFITFMFAALFKILPNKKLSWRQISGGAAVTAAMFVLGKFLIGLYLALSTTSNVFGAAGTLAALLMWFYLSAQMFLFGATLTHAWVKIMADRDGDASLD